MACGLARGGLQVGLQLGVCLTAGREADTRLLVAGVRHVGYQAQGDKDAHCFLRPRGVKAANGAKKRRIDRVPGGVPVVIIADGRHGLVAVTFRYHKKTPPFAPI
nr:MAG TPA: hypothetical protein [Caudoviricetes sp.]